MDKLTELSVKLFALNEIRKDLENEIYKFEKELELVLKKMLINTKVDKYGLDIEAHQIYEFLPLKHLEKKHKNLTNKISQIKSELYTLLEL